MVDEIEYQESRLKQGKLEWTFWTGVSREDLYNAIKLVINDNIDFSSSLIVSLFTDSDDVINCKTSIELYQLINDDITFLYCGLLGSYKESEVFKFGNIHDEALKKAYRWAKILGLYSDKVKEKYGYCIEKDSFSLPANLLSLVRKEDEEKDKPQQCKTQETQENHKKPIQNINITDDMVTDFANKFGVDKKDNYREILEHIAPLKSAAIAHYLRKCKCKDKQLRSDVSILELHNWLKDNNFNVREKYDTFQKAFN